MRALIVESPPDLPADWLKALTDEFIEDPQCRMAVFGGDARGAVVFSLWDSAIADEVAAGIRETLPAGADLRLLSLADSGFGEGLDKDSVPQ